VNKMPIEELMQKLKKVLEENENKGIRVGGIHVSADPFVHFGTKRMDMLFPIKEDDPQRTGQHYNGYKYSYGFTFQNGPMKTAFWLDPRNQTQETIAKMEKIIRKYRPGRNMSNRADGKVGPQWIIDFFAGHSFRYNNFR
jgi:hypothetical protein